MTDREKLIELIGQVQYLGGLELALADHLIANGVTFATDNNVGDKMTPTDKDTNVLTNADRIRAMSDEELAHELAMVAGWDREQYQKAQRIGLEKVMLDWLKQSDGEIKDEAY